MKTTNGHAPFPVLSTADGMRFDSLTSIGGGTADAGFKSAWIPTSCAPLSPLKQTVPRLASDNP